MSGATTIAGNGYPGLVTIHSSLSFGALSTPGSVNSLIQSYLNDIGAALGSGTDSFENYNPQINQTHVVPGTGSGFVEQISNLDSAGGSTSGSGSYPALTVQGGVSDLLLQAPGNMTVTGASSTTNVVIDALTNADYSVTDAAAGTMYLAGGANSVTLYNTSGNTNESIYSAGQDTINLAGQGTAQVTVTGDATVIDKDVNASVVASGSATTNLFWSSANAGGTLNFTNNSSVAATIHIQNGSKANVTAFGGVGGGFYVGGAAGNNSLVGGSGVVTLVGAGAGDFLEAQSSIGTNVLAQGVGNETLMATSTTGSNVFGAGLQYPGLGSPEVTGVISTDGSGVQQFLLGNLAAGETIFGSTQAGASNNYFVVGNTAESIGGGQISIYNFVDAKSTILLTNGNAGASDASISSMGYNTFQSAWDISLSDGTNILLKNLTLQQMGAIHTVAGAGGTTAIVG